MTGSAVVAPPIGGTAPEPQVDEIPPDAIEPGAEEPPEKRRRKLALLFLLLGLLAGLLLLVIWYFLFRQPLPLPVFPETQVPSFSYNIYGVGRPVGIAVSPTGERIYVTETEGERVVRVFDDAGNPIGTLRPPETLLPAGGTMPVYLAIDPLTDEVYVTDRPTGSVFVYSADGEFLREYRPQAAASGWQPLAIAFDAAGLLYVTDLGEPAQRVVVFDRDGQLVRTIGAEAGLSFPNGVTVDDAGLVYVTDSNNGRLLVFDQDGRRVGQIGRGVGQGNLGLPRGAAIDGKGRVFVVDSSGQGLFVYRALASGEDRPAFLGYFGGAGIQNGQFRFPNGVAVDDRGRVFVADSANDRIQVWSY